MYETLYDLLHRKPFKPFQVRLSNGESYTIRHPERVLLMRTWLVITWPKEDRFVIHGMREVQDVKSVQTKPRKK